jgi:hypothetical protein
VTLLGWVWLVSPFVVIALVAHDAQLQRFVAAHYDHCRAAGWAGVVMMFAGAALAPVAPGIVMFTIGTPLVGLVVWLRDDGNDGGEGEPDSPPLDWHEFERSFWAHVRSRRRLPRNPRTPTAC